MQLLSLIYYNLNIFSFQTPKHRAKAPSSGLPIKQQQWPYLKRKTLRT